MKLFLAWLWVCSVKCCLVNWPVHASGAHNSEVLHCKETAATEEREAVEQSQPAVKGNI